MSKIALPLAGRPGEGGGYPPGGSGRAGRGGQGGVGGGPPPGSRTLVSILPIGSTGPATSTMALVTLVKLLDNR